jgi:arsenate reductase-like glutaredoxin family protein
MPVGSRSARPEGGAVDALSLLKEDHDKVKDMLEKLDQTTERAVKTREEVFTKLKSDLEVHETIEEELLYPALKEHAETKEIALEAWEEHHVVDVVMGEISETPFDDETWGAKLSVMKENLEHHIEEEEGELFEQARDVIGTDGLEELGRRMEARKKELMAA